jgi:hypothetical protein
MLFTYSNHNAGAVKPEFPEDFRNRLEAIDLVVRSGQHSAEFLAGAELVLTALARLYGIQVEPAAYPEPNPSPYGAGVVVIPHPRLTR